MQDDELLGGSEGKARKDGLENRQLGKGGGGEGQGQRLWLELAGLLRSAQSEETYPPGGDGC